MRTERDALGERTLPDDALYGINTARALENFALGGHPVRHSLIRAMILVKKAAAQTYLHIGEGRPDVEQAIVAACDRLLAADLTTAFPLQALQGGAGTSTHMNVNEVLANLALRELGYEPGRYDIIHPLDDVNRGQSTNDVYPTALRIASICQLGLLSEQCAKLQTALQEKENAWETIPKLGRTEWMDAVPITLGGEFGAYAQAIARDRWRLYKAEERLRVVNIGGTAVGTSQGAARRYRFGVIEELRRLTGIGLAAAEYPMDITQNNDVFVETSGLAKALAVNLMKIADDLRRMNSGPHGGLGEIRLAKLQQGSSIMPGKVNPVIPEMTIQCAIKVMANDSAISQAASHGEFELNAFLPLIADCMLENLELLTECTRLFRERCIEPLAADEENCRRHLEASHAQSMAWMPILGYDTVAAIVKDYPPEEARKRLQRESESKRKETEGEGKSDSH
ncbi:MAG: aspartate ammonia-lyase [Clostridiales bacterium]|nr:aspartate ammonia-lyase [Clostridiales bacterium]